MTMPTALKPPRIDARCPRPFAVFFVAALATLAIPVHAALYKWTDSAGRVVYSDQPPSGNVKYELVGAPPPPANPNAAKELANREAEFKKRQADQAESAAKAEKANADAVTLRSQCQQLRNQIAGLAREDIAIARINEKGERVPMTTLQRNEEIAKLEQMMRDRGCVRTNSAP